MFDAILKLVSIAAQVAQIFTVIGIFLLFRQIEISRKTTQGQFINELEKEFSSYHSVYSKLKPGGSWDDLTKMSHDEISDIEMLAAFCEKLKHFLDRGLLDWPTLDLMFRHRFFIIMKNRNVLDHLIKPHHDDWKAALELLDEWKKRLPSNDPRRI